MSKTQSPPLWWWYQGYTHTSEHNKMYTLEICKFYISIIPQESYTKTE